MSNAVQFSAALSGGASIPTSESASASMHAAVERLVQARAAVAQPWPITEEHRVLARGHERIARQHLATSNSPNYAERASVLLRLSTVFELAERQRLALASELYLQGADLFGALRPWPTLRGTGNESARNYVQQLVTYAVSAALTCNSHLGRWGLLALAERDRTIAARRLTADDLGLRSFKSVDVLRARLASLAARAQ